jgi:hypothetical protein
MLDGPQPVLPVEQKLKQARYPADEEKETKVPHSEHPQAKAALADNQTPPQLLVREHGKHALESGRDRCTVYEPLVNGVSPRAHSLVHEFFFQNMPDREHGRGTLGKASRTASVSAPLPA